MVGDALSVAERGIRVHPLRAKTKIPHLTDWAKKATTDPKQIRAWWKKWPNANVGIVAGETVNGDYLTVLDVDPRANGDLTLEALVREHGELPETYEVATGGEDEGWQLYLSSQKPVEYIVNLGPGLELLGENHNVVAPPSVHPDTGRKYKCTKPFNLAPLPAWLLEVGKHVAKERVSPEAIGAGVDKLKEHEGRNIAAASIAGGLRRAGLSVPAIHRGLEALSPHIFEENLTQEELESTVLKSAAKWEPGSVNGDGSGVYSKEPFTIYTASELAALPDPEWVVKGFVVEGLTMIVGGPGTYKSFAALDACLHVAVGKRWHGQEVKQGHVVYLAGEGAAGLKKRVRAWCEHHGVSESELDHFLVVPLAPNLMRSEQVERLASTLRLLPDGPVLVCVDTLARAMHGGNENAVEDVGKVIGALDELRVRFGCSALLLHHVGKDGVTSRGSSALEGAADLMWKFSRGRRRLSIETGFEKPPREFEPPPLVTMTLAECADSLVIAGVDSTGGTAGAIDDQDRKILALIDGSAGTEWAPRSVLVDASELKESAFNTRVASLCKRDLVEKDRQRKNTYYRLTEAGRDSTGVATAQHRRRSPNNSAGNRQPKGAGAVGRTPRKVKKRSKS